LLHKMLVRWYMCLAITRGDGEDWSNVRNQGKLLVMLENALQPFYRAEWWVLYCFFIACMATITLHEHMIEMGEGEGQEHEIERNGEEFISEKMAEHYAGTELDNLGLLTLAFLVFKCQSLAVLGLVAVHLISHAVVDGIWSDEVFIQFYPVVGLLLLVASRHFELFYRSTVFNTNRVAREKGQRRRLLENFAFMVDIAAWEWDASGPMETHFYQTRVIEGLTGRASRQPTGRVPYARLLDGPVAPALAPSEASAPASVNVGLSVGALHIYRAHASKPPIHPAAPSSYATPATRTPTTKAGSSMVATVTSDQPTPPRPSPAPLQPKGIVDDGKVDSEMGGGSAKSAGSKEKRSVRSAGGGGDHHGGENATDDSTLEGIVLPMDFDLPIGAGGDDKNAGDIVLTDERLRGFWTQHVHPNDRGRIERAIVKCVDQGEPYDMNIRYERSDGEIRFFQAGGRRASPTSTIIYGYIQDVTERKREKASLEHRVGILSRVLEATVDATIVADTQEDMIVESSTLLNSWTARTLEGMPLSTLLNAWAIGHIKSDAAFRHPPQPVTVILQNPTRPEQLVRGELTAFADADDPALVFVAFNHLHSVDPPHLPLRHTATYCALEPIPGMSCGPIPVIPQPVRGGPGGIGEGQGSPGMMTSIANLFRWLAS
ncbi:unnamed protein product, partial [Vitrella brassicaformis CCMP3155]